MAVNRVANISYGLDAPLIVGAPTPIVSPRAPGVNDRAEIGTVWINQTDNSVYTLTSIVANSATWTNTAGAGEIVESITATIGPNSLTGTTTINTAGAGNTTIGTGGTGFVHIGNATGNTAVTGSLATTTTLSAGTTLTAGTGITSTTGNIVASAGNVSSTTGSVSAGTTVTAGTGITATTGNIVASTGNITATLGNISSAAGSVSAATTLSAGTGISTSTGNITATIGNLLLPAIGSEIIFGAGAINIAYGAGAPGFNAPKGSLYLRTDGSGVNDRAYIATDAVGTWTAIVTVA